MCDLIGQGSFGQIFRGSDTAKDNRNVAIKVEPKYCNDQSNDPRRLVIECKVLVEIRGKRHIPLMYASGKSASGNPFIVMQYLGDNLTTLRKQRPQQKFSKSTSFRVAQQVIIWLMVSSLHLFTDCPGIGKPPRNRIHSPRHQAFQLLYWKGKTEANIFSRFRFVEKLM